MLGKVLVTGGLGNLGSWATKALVDEGYEVYVLTREKIHMKEDDSYALIEADITCIEVLKQKLNIKFDFCVHMASYNESFQENYANKALEINTQGTRNLLEILVQNGLNKFIYLSTVHVYGEREGLVEEDDVLLPQNDYASTHLFAEYYVKQFGITHHLDYTILRLTNSYGAPVFYENSKWYLVLNDLVKSAYEHKLIQLHTNGEASRDFMWMGDVSTVITQVLSHECHGIYNLSSMKNYKISELAQMVKSIYKKRYNLLIDISLNTEDRMKYKIAFIDNSKLQKQLKYEVKDYFSEEIDKIFDLLEQNDTK